MPTALALTLAGASAAAPPALVDAFEDDDAEPPTNRPSREAVREAREPAPAPAADADAEADEAAPADDFWSRERLTGDLYGLWPWLEDRGVSFSATLLYDYGAVLSGGVRRREAGRGLLDIDATFDMARIAGIDGAAAFIEFLNHWGRDGSQDAGDFQAFDNIDGPQFAQISELWWEQKLFGERLRLKLGKLDANTEFAYAELAGDFLNSSFGFSPTNFAMPSYPDPATALVAFIYPTDGLFLGFGVFDGATQAGIPTGTRGPRTFFSAPSDLYFIGEFGLTWDSGGRAGRAVAGGWGHNGRFEEFDGGSREGAAGFYASFDQVLWREGAGDSNHGRSLGITALYGWAEPDVSDVEHHLALGLVWEGLIPGREDDGAGVGATWVHFSDEQGAGFGDDEVAIELYYRVQITPFCSVKPDLQYIANPGGDPAVDDALVATIRVELLF